MRTRKEVIDDLRELVPRTMPDRTTEDCDGYTNTEVMQMLGEAGTRYRELECLLDELTKIDLAAIFSPAGEA